MQTSPTQFGSRTSTGEEIALLIRHDAEACVTFSLVSIALGYDSLLAVNIWKTPSSALEVKSLFILFEEPSFVVT